MHYSQFLPVDDDPYVLTTVFLHSCIPGTCVQYPGLQSIANNSGYRYRLFHSRTKSASLDSHMYVSGWLLCCHEPKYLQVSLHQALSGPDQDDIFCQDLIHCSGR